MKHTSIAIIGAGNVGTTTAYAIMLKNLAAEIILVDIDEKRCRGEILDLQDVLSFCSASQVRTGSVEDANDADIIIIAAGAPQKIGQPRTELIETNKKVIESIFNKLTFKHSHTIVIIVSNPVDILTSHAQKIASIEKRRIIGSGTYLDSQRLRVLIAKELSIAEESVHAFIIGEHGDTQVAVWSSAHVDGVPLSAFSELTSKKLADFAQQTINKAYEIIACKGATYYGIASCVASLCETIFFNQKRILPLSVYIDEFDVCLSMPVVLGEQGVESYLTLPLNEQEREQLEKSASVLKEFQ
jgi:L-lactate dehydrogenase